MRFAATFLVGLAMLATGCSDSKSQVQREFNAVDAALPAGVAAKAARENEAPAMDNFVVHQAEDRPAGGPALAKPPAELPAKRRIIYSASMDLVVTDFGAASKKLQQIVDDHGGYIAKSDVGEISGERR